MEQDWIERFYESTTPSLSCCGVLWRVSEIFFFISIDDPPMHRGVLGVALPLTTSWLGTRKAAPAKYGSSSIQGRRPNQEDRCALAMQPSRPPATSGIMAILPAGPRIQS